MEEKIAPDTVLSSKIYYSNTFSISLEIWIVNGSEKLKYQSIHIPFVIVRTSLLLGRRINMQCTGRPVKCCWVTPRRRMLCCAGGAKSTNYSRRRASSSATRLPLRGWRAWQYHETIADSATQALLVILVLGYSERLLQANVPCNFAAM